MKVPESVRRHAVPAVTGGIAMLAGIRVLQVTVRAVGVSERVEGVAILFALVVGGAVAAAVGPDDRAGGVVDGTLAGVVAGLAIFAHVLLTGEVGVTGPADAAQLFLGILFFALWPAVFGLVGGLLGHSLLGSGDTGGVEPESV